MTAQFLKVLLTTQLALNYHQSLLVPTSNSLNVFYANYRSLLPKIDHLRALASTQLPDVILLCETWLVESITDSELSIINYSICCRDRNRQGGGVAVYICDNIPFSIHFSHSTIQLLVVDLKLKNGNLLYGVFYRPPSAEPTVLNFLESALEEIHPNKQKSFALLGDFSVDLSNQNYPQLSHLYSIQDKLNLHQVVSEPTRFSSSTDSVIDHAYLSNSALLSSCETALPLKGSDHSSLCLSLHLSPPTKKKVRRRVWMYKQDDFEGANDLLQWTPSDIYYDNDVNYFWMKWRDFFLVTMDSCISSKNISSTKSLPYINRGQ